MKTHKLAFFLEENDRDVYSGRPIDFDAYRYSCKAFGVPEMAVINSDKIEYSFQDKSIKLTEYSSFEDFCENNKNQKIILLEAPWSAPAGCLTLGKHEVSEDIDWFVVGPSTGWYPHPEGFEWLSIPQDGKGALHGQHIATLLLGFIFLEKKVRK